MNSLIQKVAGLLPILEKRGVIYLFAFVEREDVDRWDVLLSSEWSDKEIAMATFVVSKALIAQLEPHEMTMLSRVVIIPSDEARNLLELPENPNDISPENPQIIYGNFLGLPVKRAILFRMREQPHESDALRGTVVV